MFFLEAQSRRRLAIHVEMKRAGEAFSHGQPEAYRPRAACFQEERRPRGTLLSHDDWLTVLFCGEDALGDPRLEYFDNVITHARAAGVIGGYPGE